MRYYTYNIFVGNADIPENELTREEKELGYIPTKLERVINDIYNGDEEVVNMTITPIMKSPDPIPVAYHVIYITKDKK